MNLQTINDDISSEIKNTKLWKFLFLDLDK